MPPSHHHDRGDISLAIRAKATEEQVNIRNFAVEQYVPADSQRQARHDGRQRTGPTFARRGAGDRNIVRIVGRRGILLEHDVERSARGYRVVSR